MKFYCDACHTKYAISDEKVRGKILRIRCKKCGNVITVREHEAPVEAKPPVPAPKPDVPVRAPRESIPTTSWYYALNGETFGPYTLAVLREKYATASLTDATYVWHETLEAWKPVATVPAFAEALTRGQKIRPRMRTLGFSGALEAVKVDERQAGPKAGAVPTPSRSTATVEEPRHAVDDPPDEPQTIVEARPEPSPRSATPPPKPKPVATPEPQPKPRVAPSTPKPDPRPPKPKAATPPPRPDLPRPRLPSKPETGASQAPEARPLKDARQEKLDRLRKRLTLDGLAKTPAIGRRPPTPEEAEPRDTTEEPRPAELVEPDDVAPLPEPVAGAAQFTFAAGVEPTTETKPEPDDAPDDAVNFDLPPRVKASPPQPSPSSTSDILDRIVDEPPPDEEHVEDPMDSGIVPIFGTTDEPASEPVELPKELDHAAIQSAIGGTTDSVLLEMKSLQSEGRGKRGFVAAASVAALVLVLIVAAVIATSSEDDVDPGATVEAPAVGPNTEQKKELVPKTYSKEELARIQTIQLAEDELLPDDGEPPAGELDETQPGEGAGAVVEAANAETGSPAEPAARAPERPEARPSEEKQPEAKRAKVAAAPTDATPKEGAEAADEKPSDADLVNTLLKPRKEIAVQRPVDELATRTEEKAGLSKQQAVAGFRHITSSVRLCRETHNRRSPPLDVGKIKVRVTVQPEGAVSQFDIQSSKVKHTEFERCMEQRRKRWRFPEFEGTPAVIETSLIL